MPGMLLLHPLPLTTLQDLACTPALVRRTEALLSAHELRQRLQAALLHLAAFQHAQSGAPAPEAGAHDSSSKQGPRAAGLLTSSGPLLVGPEELLSSLPPVADILAAVTAKSTGEAFDCEAAEVVGDAALDYIAVLHLFHTLP